MLQQQLVHSLRIMSPRSAADFPVFSRSKRERESCFQLLKIGRGIHSQTFNLTISSLTGVSLSLFAQQFIRLDISHKSIQLLSSLRPPSSSHSLNRCSTVLEAKRGGTRWDVVCCVYTPHFEWIENPWQFHSKNFRLAPRDKWKC